MKKKRAVPAFDGYGGHRFGNGRLSLRELIPGNKDELKKILCDPESMSYYLSPFSEEKVEAWITWNRENYRRYGHGSGRRLYGIRLSPLSLRSPLHLYEVRQSSFHPGGGENGMKFLRYFRKTIDGERVEEALYRRARGYENV